jgi:hypothetical protein
MSEEVTNPPKRGRGPGRPFSKNQILYSRKHTAEVLGVSIDKVKELEKLGRLNKVRLTPNGDVHHTASEVAGLAKGGKE